MTHGPRPSALHKYVWQSIPYGWRRRALFETTSAIAPRPAAGARRGGPLTVVGHLNSMSGLGYAAQLARTALTQATGVAVGGIDIPPSFGTILGPRSAYFGPGTLIVHVNSPLMPLAMLRLGRTVVADKYVVGVWMWELPQVPPDWRFGLPFVHEIWAPSAFTADAIRPIAGKRPVRVMPLPVAIEMDGAGGRRPQARAADERFEVLTIFNMASGFARKNPLAAIAAFRRAFGDAPAARLTVQVTNGAINPVGMAAIRQAADGGSIRIMTDTLPREKLLALYDASHVLISLHRAEGFGLTPAEAMLRGLPVVATNWSGNVDFLTAATGCPVDFTLVPAVDPQQTYHYPNLAWAEADVANAAVALQRLCDDEPGRRALGAAAAHFAAEAFSARRYGARAAEALAAP